MKRLYMKFKEGCQGYEAKQVGNANARNENDYSMVPPLDTPYPSAHAGGKAV